MWQDEDKVRAAFEGAETMMDAFKMLGLDGSTYHYKSARIYLPKYGIPKPVVPTERMSAGAKAKNTMPLEDILVKDSPYLNTDRLKKKLISVGLLVRVCADCGNTGTWQGKPLVLQLEHRNGDSRDNRIENLELLCPNCHSQTATFSRRKSIEV